MKKTKLFRPILAILLLAVLFSCKKDETFTVENKLVTGTMSYVLTGAVPLEVDPNTQQPILIQFSFDGTGTIDEIGPVTCKYTFVFDFRANLGKDFDVTYTGESASDSFWATGYSEMNQDGTFTVLEMLSNGTGKFENLLGGGETLVTLNAERDAGTGEAEWTITY